MSPNAGSTRLRKIINIAGTNGSGKSTIARALLQEATESVPLRREGRAAPIGYDLTVPGVEGVVHLVGAYEVPTGGCDTIRDVNEVFRLIEQEYSAPLKHVVYEGAIVMNMVRGVTLAQAHPNAVTVLLLTTPLEACIKAINGRRLEQGEGPLPDRENVVSNWKRAYSYGGKMQQAGARLFKLPREKGLAKLLEVLRG